MLPQFIGLSTLPKTMSQVCVLYAHTCDIVVVCGAGQA